MYYISIYTVKFVSGSTLQNEKFGLIAKYEGLEISKQTLNVTCT